MSNLKTPGVKIEEVSKLPTSVAQVETAIPAFIGYTKNQIHEDGKDVIPTRISSMLEFEKIFGGAKAHQIVFTEDAKGGISLTGPSVQFLMAYQLQMYFANGGGPCYIVSLGKYENLPNTGQKVLDAHKAALTVLEREDEPTLIVLTDATKILGDKYYEGFNAALAHADTMKDRFVLIDTLEPDSTKIGEFRTNISANKYGAAYFPHLNSVLTNSFIEKTEIAAEKIKHELVEALQVKFTAEIKWYKDSKTQLTGANPPAGAALTTMKNEGVKKLEYVNNYIEGTYTTTPISTAADAAALAAAFQTIINYLDGADPKKRKYGPAHNASLSDLKTANNKLYQRIKAALGQSRMMLPPSAAMAGVYAKVDSSRGVWKAPANVSLNYVSSVTEKIDDKGQENLNVHDTGKSINAIRNFRGKGTMVWGARTLDGNSNEWRYVPVRRLFNMVEESVSKAADRYVFESNDANTWTRVKAMIENYLLGLWKEGALAGASPEDAFYVSIGLGETMDAQDVLNGRMNIEIGMAAVRPAEFIVLKFSHKLQES